MAKRAAKGVDPGLVDVVWGIVLIQGGVVLLNALEGFIGGFSFGSLPAAVAVGGLSLLGAIIALLSARGLRRRRRWARRVTLVAEWLVLAGGLLNALATSLIAAEVLGLVSITTTIVAPLTVIVVLHNLRHLYVPEDDRSGQIAPELESA